MAARPGAAAPGEEGRGGAHLDPEQDAFVLTFAADKGAFADSSKLDAVPEESREVVRVKLLQGPAAPAGTVWVADLREPDDDGGFPLQTVPRDEFEERALGTGHSSPVDLAKAMQGNAGQGNAGQADAGQADAGQGDPVPQPAKAGEVIVYKTSWCGVCKKLEGYLRRKGVQYVAKDIEKDKSAARELRSKGRAAGIQTSSVPIIDVGGELLVGFDRRRLEKLL